MSNGLLLLGVHKKRTTAAGGGGVAPTVSNTKFAGISNTATTISITPDSDVTSGRLGVVVVEAYIYDAAFSAPILASYLTKTGGTSTIDTITLDVTNSRGDHDTAADDIVVGIYSFPITGAGTLTMTFNPGGLGTNSYFSMEYMEIANADTSGTRVNGTSSANTGSTTSPDTGNVSTGGAGIIVAALAPGYPYGTITITEDGAFSLVSEQQADVSFNYSLIYRSSTTNITDSGSWSTGGTTCEPVSCAVAYKSSTP